MDQDRLHCALLGGKTTFYVNINKSTEVFELKESIVALHPHVNDEKFTAANILLYKVDMDLDQQDNQDALGSEDLLRSKLGPQALNIWARPSEVFADRLGPNSRPSVLNIIVVVAGYDGHSPPRKKARVTVDEPQIPESVHAAITALQETYWRKGTDCFLTEAVQVPSSACFDARTTETAGFIELPPAIATYFGISKLFIPETYKTFWDLLQSDDAVWSQFFNNPNRFSSMFHGTVLQGHTGIGKSMFLLYLLIRRLLEGLTTIYCESVYSVWIFTDAGFRWDVILHDYRIPELDKESKSCALVNICEGLKTVPPIFSPKARVGRVVIASSSTKDRWGGFVHDHPANIYCMPTWTWPQIYINSLLRDSEPADPPNLAFYQVVVESYTYFPGIPRLCGGPQFFTREFKEQCLRNVDDALRDITTVDTFKRSVLGSTDFNSDVSHHLVRMEPSDRREWRLTYTELLSEPITERVFARVRKIDKIKVAETLTSLLGDQNTRAAGGKLFEAAAHRLLGKGTTLNTVPLPVPGRRKSKLLGMPASLRLKIAKIPDEGAELSRYNGLNIRKTPGSPKVGSPFIDLYMRPISNTEPSIDALYISSKVTIFFQMTVAEKHPINFRGLDLIYDQFPVAAKKNKICFVFVIPSKDQDQSGKGITSRQIIQCPQNADPAKVALFEGITQYKAVLTID